MPHTVMQYALTVHVRPDVVTHDEIQRISTVVRQALFTMAVVSKVDLKVLAGSYGPCFYCEQPASSHLTLGKEHRPICEACEESVRRGDWEMVV